VEVLRQWYGNREEVLFHAAVWKLGVPEGTIRAGRIRIPRQEGKQQKDPQDISVLSLPVKTLSQSFTGWVFQGSRHFRYHSNLGDAALAT